MTLATGVGYLTRETPLLAVCLAVLVFVGVALVTKAVPADAYHAFGLRRDRESR